MRSWWITTRGRVIHSIHKDGVFGSGPPWLRAPTLFLTTHLLSASSAGAAVIRYYTTYSIHACNRIARLPRLSVTAFQPAWRRPTPYVSGDAPVVLRWHYYYVVAPALPAAPRPTDAGAARSSTSVDAAGHEYQLRLDLKVGRRGTRTPSSILRMDADSGYQLRLDLRSGASGIRSPACTCKHAHASVLRTSVGTACLLI